MSANAQPRPSTELSMFYGWIIVAVALSIISLRMGLMFYLGVFMEPL